MRRFTLLLLSFFLFGAFTQAQETKTVGTGGDFTTMKDAIDYLNALTLPDGGVVLNVTAGETFAEEALPAITLEGTTDAPVIIQKSGDGNNPVIEVAGGSGTEDYGLKVAGADYLTIDGIDITATSDAIEYGLFVTVASDENGAQYNTFKNMNITMQTSTNGIQSVNWGVIQAIDLARTSTPASGAGTNSNNMYDGITVDGAYSGLFLLGHNYGAAEVVQDTNNTVQNCMFKNLGMEAGESRAFGFLSESQKNMLITKNTFDNIETGFRIVGIYPAEVTTDGEISYNTVKNLYCTGDNYVLGMRSWDIYRMKIVGNKFHDITSDGAEGAVAGGIELRAAADCEIVNNMVWNVKAPYQIDPESSTSSAVGAKGIGIFWCSSPKIYYNSIKIDFEPTTTLGISAGLQLLGVTEGDVRNNLVINNVASGIAGAYYITSGDTELWDQVVTSDYNYFFSINSTEVVNHLNLSADAYDAQFNEYTLDDYKTNTSLGANSVTGPVKFKADDLHIDYTEVTIIDKAGTPIDGWDIDIDGEDRDDATPEIGADEFANNSSIFNHSANETLSAYPNPTSGEFTVELEKYNTNTKLQVVNTVGQVVYKTGVKTQKTNVNIEELPTGIYFIRVINNSQVKTAKIIKE